MSGHFKQYTADRLPTANRVMSTLLLCALALCLSFFTGTVNANLSVEKLSIELSPQAQEAIKNGVSLTINCEFANIEDLLIFDRTLNKKKHYFTLSRHALSNRYIVKRDNLSRPHMFRTIAQATNYISSQAVVLLESYTVFDAERKMRITLDKFKLPGPMRLQAFIFDEWDLDTGWLAWNLER